MHLDSITIVCISLFTAWLLIRFLLFIWWVFFLLTDKPGIIAILVERGRRWMHL